MTFNNFGKKKELEKISQEERKFIKLEILSKMNKCLAVQIYCTYTVGIYHFCGSQRQRISMGYQESKGNEDLYQGTPK